ncbi:hypothetical protein Ahy_B10g104593 [Arachis hypogaea]|uniref:Aminotransferase-like plant mobile domain-containing protein n=1 Tax=Arachis hypogaea TaxID=3818 RepID=A0A444X683_ARAHY|nr:hypothetical protein Ahy_B10g104593 [Arachis hypogaea]
MKCTWKQETFSELLQDADEDTVRRYARAYIMMLLSTQLFSDMSGTRLHICWLPWLGFQPTLNEKGPRVVHYKLRIDLIRVGNFAWMSYSSPDVVQVVHPEILGPHHMSLWRSMTALIYFAVIKCHQVDRVLP